MDDSSSALDMATEERLKSSIKRRMVDSTVLIITQRIFGVMDADRIMVLDNGRMSAMGTHSELLRDNEIYRSIAVSQLGKEVLDYV